MGSPEMKEALKLSDIVALGGDRYKNGDNSYYDYEIDDEKLATIVFTSGTTGKGKGVMLSQKNIVSDMDTGHISFSDIAQRTISCPQIIRLVLTVNFGGTFRRLNDLYFQRSLYMVNEIGTENLSSCFGSVICGNHV